jgi:hypothetical protein
MCPNLIIFSFLKKIIDQAQIEFLWVPKENLQAKKQDAQSLTLHLTSLVIVNGVDIFFFIFFDSYENALSSFQEKKTVDKRKLGQEREMEAFEFEKSRRSARIN